jgi:hypothetical protein
MAPVTQPAQHKSPSRISPLCNHETNRDNLRSRAHMIKNKGPWLFAHAAHLDENVFLSMSHILEKHLDSKLNLG